MTLDILDPEDIQTPFREVPRMPTVPQQILDALNALQADADQTAVDQAALTAAQADLAAAQTAVSGAQAAVTADLAHEATDLASLQALLASTYGAPPPPPVPPGP